MREGGLKSTLENLMQLKTIVTHNGAFHTDEIFAVATILLALSGKKSRIVRTRDESFFGSADFVVDVGGVYEPSTNRFDHHQIGGAGARENNLPYASFGLVWRKYGEELSGSKEAARRIDLRLVCPVDAVDNGVASAGMIFENIYSYTITDFFSSFYPLYNAGHADTDKAFLEAVTAAKELLQREIDRTYVVIELEERVREIYSGTEKKEIIIFDDRYPWKEVLIAYPEPVYVIYPDKNNDAWAVKAVNVGPQSFALRKPFPEEWAGKQGRDLAEASGVPDAIFCHNARFIAIAKSKEGAMALANKALNS